MIYELIITIFVEQQEELEDILDKLADLMPNTIVVHPESPNQECSIVKLIKCRHDETPPQPCSVVSYWDNCPLKPPPDEPA